MATEMHDNIMMGRVLVYSCARERVVKLLDGFAHAVTFSRFCQEPRFTGKGWFAIAAAGVWGETPWSTVERGTRATKPTRQKQKAIEHSQVVASSATSSRP